MPLRGALLFLLLVWSGCVGKQGIQPRADVVWIRVINNSPAPIEVYPRAGSSRIPYRLGRIEPLRSGYMKVPVSYLNTGGFNLEICRTSGAAPALCVEAQRHYGNFSEMQLVIIGGSRPSGDFYGR